MHRHPHSALHNPSLIPTISVCGTEVPLPLYFQVNDLYNAGHNIDSILVHIVTTTQVSSIDILRETVQNIILNQQLINNSPHRLTLPINGTEQNEGTIASRRNSRIEFVGELDDLDSARLLAEDKQRKEKERRTLKQLLAKFG